ncbi:hypothetical protein H70357_17720 [Paenibacillus sp. FSL H7-0357]|uniref:hypothetical protein n=1 Tax=Paenibacillus sp. FSL H7-0357 TaxID=1536774 RepID=UPI0004F7F52E|nr:hypothetical protein [Paenibacillus sp. FSL H7-0357]AIQ18320.1 hypothetical protein H70357_17720 [Paenibacillus sp. FSL H7-0357]
MTGPSLRQLHAHHAIHQGGLSGAIAKTEEVEELLEAKEIEVARQAADHLIEYWETRIISHADAEEDGLIPEVIHQFHALLVVNSIHSRDEERLLLAEA